MDSNFYYTFNGFIVHDLAEVPINGIVQKHYRLFGGKGGFGSMLRAIGSQIEKTTNREMCRDLNGRRMRDVNNEKRLKDWLDNADSREREKLESYLEKRRKRKLLLDQGPSAKLPYEDRSVEEQRKQIAEELQDAICEAFENRKQPKSLNKVNAKPKKIILDVDSDIESSSSSSSKSPSYIPTTNDNLGNSAECGDGFSVLVESVSDDKLENEDVGNLEHFTESKPSLEKYAVETSKTNGDISKSEESVKEVLFADIDLGSVGSVTHLLTYGADWIKNDLMRRGLKSGGTLMERAQRLYSVKGLTEYPASLLVGAVRTKRR